MTNLPVHQCEGFLPHTGLWVGKELFLEYVFGLKLLVNIEEKRCYINCELEITVIIKLK